MDKVSQCWKVTVRCWPRCWSKLILLNRSFFFTNLNITMWSEISEFEILQSLKSCTTLSMAVKMGRCPKVPSMGPPVCMVGCGWGRALEITTPNTQHPCEERRWLSKIQFSSSILGWLRFIYVSKFDGLGYCLVIIAGHQPAPPIFSQGV